MEDGIGEKKEGLSYLLDKARGPDRSYREYAKAAGVSATAITRMRKGDYTPKPDTIEKLTSKAADPRGGVTYTEMMKAAGYSVGESEDIAEAAGIESESADDSDESRSLRQSLKRAEIREAWIQFDRAVTTQIYTSLADKGIVFKREEVMIRKMGPEGLYIQLFEQPIKDWMFNYRYSFGKGSGVNISRIEMMLGNAMLTVLDKDIKLSYVVNDSKLYQYLERYDHRLPIKGEVSVILFDQETKLLIDEFYLSNRIEGDRTKEVYLA